MSPTKRVCGHAAPPPRVAPSLVTVEIDGERFQVEEGRNMLDVALSLGFDLPFFCWHPVMGSIGACRQCAVRLFWTGRDGEEKSEIAMACMTEAQEGTRISIADEEAVRFRARMIELMMMSHPHDCPVCDEGGECHLQDMTVMTGHTYRRYEGVKRTFENQDLGPFVTHELNRCITCYRCTRFYNDFAGGRDFGAFGLRHQIYFGRAGDGALENEFSGNLIEVCPTGVFDDKPFSRRYSRKWDLQTAPSVCPHCGLGCTTTPGARYGELRRVLSRYNRDVNKMFLCDRGRFGADFVNAPSRVRDSQVSERALETLAGAPAGAPKAAGDGEPAPPAERAVSAAAALLRGRRAIGIGSPRASLEANFALRTLVGADRFYLGMSETDYDLVGLVADVLAAGTPGLASLADVSGADAVFVIGEDVTNTAPMVDLTLRTWLRLRPTAEEARVDIRSWNDAAVGRAKRREPSVLWVAGAQATRLDEVAAETWRAAPDDLARFVLALAHEIDGSSPKVDDLTRAERSLVKRWATVLCASRAPLIVSGTSSGSTALLQAVIQLARVVSPEEGQPAVPRLLLTVPEANSLGLRLMGGGRLEQTMTAVARDAAAAVVVLDNDLYRRLPALLADDLLRRHPALVALATLDDRVVEQADVVLPAATFAESTGTFVNNEGRAQRHFAVLPPGGDVREAWHWVLDLLRRLKRPEAQSWKTLDDVIAALELELPQFRGVASAAPPASWRGAGRKVARQPGRSSGRTAEVADRTVHEPAPTADPDSALAYSLEGLTPEQAPAALVPRVWAPGWDSGNGLHKLQEEVVGPLRGEPAGALLRPAGDAGAPQPLVVPPAFAPRGDEFLLVAAHHIFGSDDLSMRAPAVAERAGQTYIGINEADAERLGLHDGDWVELWLPWLDWRARYVLMPSLATGTAAVPVGLAGTPYISLPARRRLTRVEAAP
jgi:NADH-quinone oxidoreductase subunit G